MTTSAQSRNSVHAKLKQAQDALSVGGIAAGRAALSAAIVRATNRSNLPANDPNRIPPEEAASVVCAAGNLLERVRPE